MKIHCTVMVLVIAAGIILKLSITEWCICLVLFGVILALELVNTAIERWLTCVGGVQAFGKNWLRYGSRLQS